jgi:hypothetical protein
MLVAGQVPHEFREFARLLRKIGVGERWESVRQRLDRSNPYVMRFDDYLNVGSEQGA